jgi:hypothetical protein
MFQGWYGLVDGEITGLKRELSRVAARSYDYEVTKQRLVVRPQLRWKLTWKPSLLSINSVDS